MKKLLKPFYNCLWKLDSWHSVARYCTEAYPVGPKKKRKFKQPQLHMDHEVIKQVSNLYNKSKKSDFLEDKKKQLIHSILTSQSQVVGFKLDEVNKRVDMFKQAGLSIGDATTLSLSIPSCLQINNNNFKRIVSLLKSYNLPVEKIIHNHPYIGALDHRQVERNLKLLSNDLEMSDELSSLVLACPMLLSYILNKHSIDLLKGSMFSLKSSQTICKNIELSMNGAGVLNKSIEDFIQSGESFNELCADAIEFLTYYEINVEKIYISCPELFITPKETLETCVANITSAPFFFEAADLEGLISNYPNVFLQFHKKDVLKQSRFIANVSAAKARAFRVLKDYPEIFLNPKKFFHRVQMFETYNIKDGNIGRLLAQKGGANCFIDCEDFIDKSLKNRLKFLSSKKDLTPLQIVVSAPVSLSARSSDILEARLSFMRHKDKVGLFTGKKKIKRTQITLQSIIRSNLKTFVETVCETTLEDYESFCKQNKLKNFKVEFQNAGSESGDK